MNELNLTIPGFSIAGKTWGNPEKPAILALHGWLDNADSFALIAPYLQNDFYFIAVDLPGHGHSDHLPIGCNYHFFEAIFTIIELINALKLDKVHILGHSMGACLGSLLAGVVPERLLSLYLIEALGPFSAPAETACKQLKTYAHFLRLKNSAQSKGYQRFDDAVLARSAKGYVSLDIAQILCERALIEKDGVFYWRHDKRLLASSPLRMTEEQILSCLQNIQAKTELLLSSDGFYFDEKIIENRIKMVKNIKVKKLNGGHHIHMEQPEVVSQLLADYYRRL
jgi:pimeloyl-ACP methyl ester carboxylesterase